MQQIYICGYSLRLSGSNTPYELSQNLHNKVNMVKENSSRFPNKEFDVPNFGTLKQDISMLDNTFFGINGNQTEKIDPQSYLLLETSVETIIDSGLNIKDLQNTETGVYIGACFSDMNSLNNDNIDEISGYEVTGCSTSMFSNRISHFF